MPFGVTFIIGASEGDLGAKGGDDVGGDVGVREPLPPLLLSSVCLRKKK